MSADPFRPGLYVLGRVHGGEWLCAVFERGGYRCCVCVPNVFPAIRRGGLGRIGYRRGKLGTGTGWLILIGPVSDQCHRVLSILSCPHRVMLTGVSDLRNLSCVPHVRFAESCGMLTVSQSALRSPCHSVNSLDRNS